MSDDKYLIPRNIPTMPLGELFRPDVISDLIDAIKKQALEYDPDTSTGSGRRAIASRGAQVARSKVFIDDKGKELVSEWKNKAKQVDVQRKVFRDAMDSLKDQVRKPLTDWEVKRKEEEEQERKRLEAERLREEEEKQRELDALRAKVREQELEAKRREEETLAKQIALEAEKRAEEKARIEAVRAVEQARIDTERAVEKAKIEAEKAAALEIRKKDLEIERMLAEKVEAERREQEAIQAEKDEERRLEEETKQKEILLKQKMANLESLRKYRNAVICEVCDDLENVCGLEREKAELIVEEIVNDGIRHTEIKF